MAKVAMGGITTSKKALLQVFLCVVVSLALVTSLTPVSAWALDADESDAAIEQAENGAEGDEMDPEGNAPSAKDEESNNVTDSELDSVVSNPVEDKASSLEDEQLNDSIAVASVLEESTVLDRELTMFGSFWPSFTGKDTIGMVTPVDTPTTNFSQKWETKLPTSGWVNGRSNVLIIDNDVFMVVKKSIIRIDAQTGAIVQKANLPVSINQTSRIAYADGVIYIPSFDGKVQAIAADTFETLWVTGGFNKGNNQSQSTLTVENGVVVTSTVVVPAGDIYSSEYGVVAAYDAQTGEELWVFENNEAGYYWSGGFFYNGYYVIAGDDGKVVSFNEQGKIVSEAYVGKIRSTLTFDKDNKLIYASDYEGNLHKLSITDRGIIELVASVNFGSKSTSTPALANGKVIVGGLTEALGYDKYDFPITYGRIAVIDAETMEVEYKSHTLDIPFKDPSMPDWFPAYENIEGEIQGSPLVSVQNGEMYVYFTANCYPGGIYMYHVGDETISTAFAPAENRMQYGIESVVAGPDGTLYISNDSFYLFAVTGDISHSVSFDTAGGSTIDAALVASGATVAEPAAPVKDGYEFAGWYTDAACTMAYDFASPVQASMTLYAKWNALPEPEPEPEPEVKPETPVEPSYPESNDVVTPSVPSTGGNTIVYVPQAVSNTGVQPSSQANKPEAEKAEKAEKKDEPEVAKPKTETTDKTPEPKKTSESDPAEDESQDSSMPNPLLIFAAIAGLAMLVACGAWLFKLRK